MIKAVIATMTLVLLLFGLYSLQFVDGLENGLAR